MTKQLIRNTLIALCLLVFVTWILQSFRFLSLMTIKKASLQTFFSLVVWIMPDLITLLLPTAFFFGVLVLYARYHEENFFSALQTFGCSTWALMRPAAIVGVVWMLLSYVLTLYLAPLSFQEFRNQEKSMSQYSHDILPQGEFIELGSLVLYANRVDSDGQLHGLFLYDRRIPSESKTIAASKARLFNEKDKLQISLEHGSLITDYLGKRPPSRLVFQTYNPTFNISHMAQRIKKPYEMFLDELLKTGKSVSSATKHSLRNEMLKRLLSPLLCVYVGLITAFLLVRKRIWPKRRLFLVTTVVVFFIQTGFYVAVGGSGSLSSLWYIMQFLILLIPLFYMLTCLMHESQDAVRTFQLVGQSC
jgi:lipopolysaccharide export system permease protein